MPSRFYHLAIDCRDPRALARFWAAALGQQVLAEDDEEAIVGADPHSYPGLCFLAVPDGKTIKNRLHLGGAGRSGGQRVLRAAAAPVPDRLGAAHPASAGTSMSR